MIEYLLLLRQFFFFIAFSLYNITGTNVFLTYFGIGNKDVNSYIIITEKNTPTWTACILTCENDADCTRVAYEEGQCILLRDKRRNEQKTKHSKKVMNVTTKVGSAIYNS